MLCGQLFLLLLRINKINQYHDQYWPRIYFKICSVLYTLFVNIVQYYPQYNSSKLLTRTVTVFQCSTFKSVTVNVILFVKLLIIVWQRRARSEANG